MAFEVVISVEAAEHLDNLAARDRSIVEAEISKHLVSEPTRLSKAIKRLRQNPFAQYQLRAQDFRVLYNVNEGAAKVRIVLVGRKQGNKLMVGKEEFHGHESNPAE